MKGRGWWTSRRSETGGTSLSAALTRSPGRRLRLVCYFLPPSPPAEKATAREDQARKSCTDDGAWDSEIDIRFIRPCSDAAQA
jgi:hypothetical protein